MPCHRCSATTTIGRISRDFPGGQVEPTASSSTRSTWARACGICLDTNEPGKPWGKYCEKRGAWLKRALDEAGNRPVIIFMHHPPFKMRLRRMDDISLLEPKPSPMRSKAGPTSAICSSATCTGRWRGAGAASLSRPCGRPATRWRSTSSSRPHSQQPRAAGLRRLPVRRGPDDRAHPRLPRPDEYVPSTEDRATPVALKSRAPLEWRDPMHPYCCGSAPRDGLSPSWRLAAIRPAPYHSWPTKRGQHGQTTDVSAARQRLRAQRRALEEMVRGSARAARLRIPARLGRLPVGRRGAVARGGADATGRRCAPAAEGPGRPEPHGLAPRIVSTTSRSSTAASRPRVSR